MSPPDPYTFWQFVRCHQATAAGKIMKSNIEIYHIPYLFPYNFQWKFLNTFSTSNADIGASQVEFNPSFFTTSSVEKKEVRSTKPKGAFRYSGRFPNLLKFHHQNTISGCLYISVTIYLLLSVSSNLHIGWNTPNFCEQRKNYAQNMVFVDH